jgi:hypothetical protein
MKCKLALLFLAVIVAAVVLTGCGGGGGSTNIETPGVTLTLNTSVDPIGDKSTRVVYANLDEGASVVAYNYATGLPVATGQLDANGRWNGQLPPTMTVVVVITGTRTVGAVTKTYRLSRIISMVPIADEEYVLDPISSITAELIAENHPLGNNTILDQDIVDAVQAKVQDYTDANPGADFSIGNGVYAVDHSFGAAGSVDISGMPDAVIAAQQPIDNNMVLGKNAVQQIREAGMPLTEMFAQEGPDAEAVFDGIRDKYTALSSRMGKLIMPLIVGDMEISGGDSGIGPSDLTMGHQYTMVRTGGKNVLTDNGTGSSSSQIKVLYDADGGTYTLIGTKASSKWTLTQTFTGDPTQEYTASFSDLESGNYNGPNPTLAADLSTTDSVFTTPLTFHGQLSGIGSDPDHFTKMTYEGALSSENVSSTGKIEVNFPASVPANAKPDASAYEFPTSASVTNASITVSHEDTTIRLTGALSATSATIMKNGHATVVPKTFTLQGGYSNSHSGLAFNGSIGGNWSNPGTGVSQAEMIGTFGLQGEISREGYPTYSADIEVGFHSGDISSTIDLRAGAGRLQGTFAGVLDSDGPPYGAIELTNQSGVVFNVDISSSHVVTGTIKAGTAHTQVATIGRSGSRTRVTYDTAPVTYDEF